MKKLSSYQKLKIISWVTRLLKYEQPIITHPKESKYECITLQSIHYQLPEHPLLEQDRELLNEKEIYNSLNIKFSALFEHELIDDGKELVTRLMVLKKKEK